MWNGEFKLLWAACGARLCPHQVNMEMASPPMRMPDVLQRLGAPAYGLLVQRDCQTSQIWLEVAML